MATLSPGTWNRVDAAIDPESARRLASGFWKHECSMESDIDTWVCDKRKLNEVVQRLVMDQWASKQFMRDPTRFLDARFGEGTGEAYQHAGQDRVAMRFSPWEKEMAYGKYYNGYTSPLTGSTGTTTSLYNTATTAKADRPRAKAHEQVRIGKRLIKPFSPASGVGLLTQLQADFDSMCRKELELVRG